MKKIVFVSEFLIVTVTEDDDIVEIDFIANKKKKNVQVLSVADC